MKKRFWAWLSILVLVCSFFASSLAVTARTVSADTAVRNTQVVTQAASASSEGNESTLVTGPAGPTKEETETETATVAQTQAAVNPAAAAGRVMPRRPAESKDDEIISFFGVRDQNGEYSDTEMIQKMTGDSALFYVGFELADFAGTGKDFQLKVTIPTVASSQGDPFISGIAVSDTGATVKRRSKRSAKIPSLQWIFLI